MGGNVGVDDVSLIITELLTFLPFNVKVIVSVPSVVWSAVMLKATVATGFAWGVAGI